MKIKRIKATMLMVALFLLIPLSVAAQESYATSSTANTYYDKGGKAEETRQPLKRMALVGHNCMINRLADGIKVISGSKNLSNLCDEDLDNYYILPGVADVKLIKGLPIVGVKDMKHYFDKGTKAGFKISGGSNVLNLKLLTDRYKIRFYKDGEKVGESKIKQPGYTVLSLSIGSIANNIVDIISEEAPTSDYDEIVLVGADGIDVNAIENLKIYYAFVGEGDYPLTNNRIKEYDSNIVLTPTKPTINGDKLTDENLNNGVLSLSAQVTASKTGYSGEIFPTGTEAGFVFNSADLLKLGVSTHIQLLDSKGYEVEEKTLSTDILKLSLGGEQQRVSFKATKPFSGIKLYFTGLNLGVITINYAFIVPKTETAGHQCEMSPVASLDLCNCDSHYELRWDKKNFPHAEWETAEPLPQGVKFDKNTNTLDFSETDSYKNDTGEGVTVKMKLTNQDDGCTQTITIKYGGSTEQKPDEKKENVLYNTDPKNPVYELGGGTNAGINLLSFVKNSSNIISSMLSSYATYFGGVSIGDSYLCSVKKIKGKISDETTARQGTERQVGFVVTAKGSALNADVLKMFNVRLYNEGKEVTGGVSTSAISANLIGSQDMHKLRYSIKVPANTVFDEIRLYSSGLLSANLSVMNIYYAYTADADVVLDDPLAGAEIVSFKNNNATINADRTQSAGVANAGNGLQNITNCIDGSLETKTTFPEGVKAVSGSELAVKLGITASRNKQLVVVVNKEAVGLGLDVGSAIVVNTYKTGKTDPVETFSDWSVLGANVITLGDKGYIFINPKEDYDEVAITEGNGVSALNGLAVYGLLLRNDKDGDGTPDADEPVEDCKQDLVFQETKHLSEKNQKKYKDNLTMFFQRTFVPNHWNSLTLPVNLTKEQFTNAFGEKAQLAQANKVYESAGKLIIGFSLVEENKDDAQSVYLTANTPYIIYIDHASVKDHQNQNYKTLDAGAINGEIYVVDKGLAGGVNFTYDADKATQPVSKNFTIDAGVANKWGMSDLVFYGSYDPEQALVSGSYIWNNGKMYHLTKNHKMKGYRGWLTPTWTTSDKAEANAKFITFGFGNGDISGIDLPSADSYTHDTKVYNLNGQRVDSMLGVQPGIYIVNGKKIVIK